MKRATRKLITAGLSYRDMVIKNLGVVIVDKKGEAILAS